MNHLGRGRGGGDSGPALVWAFYPVGASGPRTDSRPPSFALDPESGGVLHTDDPRSVLQAPKRQGSVRVIRKAFRLSAKVMPPV